MDDFDAIQILKEWMEEMLPTSDTSSKGLDLYHKRKSSMHKKKRERYTALQTVVDSLDAFLFDKYVSARDE